MALPGVGGQQVFLNVKVTGINTARKRINRLMRTMRKFSRRGGAYMTQVGRGADKFTQKAKRAAVFTRGTFNNSLNILSSSVGGVGRAFSMFGRASMSALKGTLRVGRMALGGIMRLGKGVIGTVRRMGGMFSQFRMEMLSLLFVGMMFQRVFMGILRSGLKMTGMLNVIGTVIQAIMVPAILAIMPTLLDLLEWFLNLPKSTKKLIGILVMLGAAFGTLTFLVSQFVMIMGTIGMSIFPILGLLGALTGSIGLVAAALGKTGDEAKGFGELLAGMFDMAKPIVKQIKVFVDNMFKVIRETIRNTDWGRVWDMLLDVGMWLISAVSDFVDEIFKTLETAYEHMQWDELWSVIFKLGNRILSEILDLTDRIFDFLYKAFKQIDWSKVWNTLFDIGMRLWQFIKKFGGQIWEFLGKIFNSINWDKAWDTVFTSILPKIGDWMRDVADAVWRELKNYFKETDWKSVWDTIFDLAIDVGVWINQITDKIWRGLKKWFTNTDWSKLWDQLFSVTKKLSKVIGKYTKNLFTKFYNFWQSKRWDKFWDEVFKFTEKVGSDIRRFVTNVFNRMVSEAGKKGWHEVWTHLFEFDTDVGKLLARFLGQVAGQIVQFFSNINWGKALKGLITGARDPQGVLDFILATTPFGRLEQGYEFMKSFEKGYSSVGDFIISDGQVIETDPRDVIMGTKTPGNMAGGGGPITVNVNVDTVESPMDVDQMVDEVERKLERDMTRQKGVM